MPFIRYIAVLVLLILFLEPAVPCFGQYGISFDVKKPKEFDKRVLRSEKPQKKFTVPRRFVQNTITHYNYFFNANNKLNEVLDKAKASFRDDFSQLIPFYNYSLDVTAADSSQLDSISSKTQTGLVLHDLRNDWADNLYLLWGASYYLRKDFDSARMMFQFINYAFAEKEKDGYYRQIGSARDGNNAFTISTKEKNSLPRRLLSEPPSRNDAFVWQIRNYLAQEQYPEASSLIQILRSDPVFPARLKNDLEEVQALYFYKHKLWDSSAAHLKMALSNATNKQEEARWEYLLGQLYELSGKNDEAEKYFTRSIGHTTDPIMDIYARLSAVRVNKDGGENYIEQNINTLLKMARRDKYVDYRDIIYFMAAQMELERNNTDGAIALLVKSTQYATNNQSQRNKAFLQLAELSFQKRRYRQSYNFYDSLQLDDPALKDVAAITARKEILKQVAENIEIVERQDSLQKLATMPEEDRKDIIKKIVRKLRKEQGLKDESSAVAIVSSKQDAPPSLFANNSKKGEWYFYNTTSRTKGLTDFKARWGSRPNADNWRRTAALSTILRNAQANAQSAHDRAKATEDKTFPPEGQGEITYDGLYANLPLTPQKMQQSNDSIQQSLFKLGLLYAQKLEDCDAAIQTLTELMARYPDFSSMDEALFNLHYCYMKDNRQAKAASVKQLMTNKHAGSKYTAILTTGKNPMATGPKEEATKAYEEIYDLFLSGNFQVAIEKKKRADSIYAANYWMPQLLYIEAVYYIKQGQDSVAKTVLNNITTRFANTPLAEKATALINALNRRKEIEEELRNLVIDSPTDDTTTRYRAGAPIRNITTAPSTVIDTTAANMPPKDTVVTKPAQPQQPVVTAPVVTQPKNIDTIRSRPPVPANTYAFTPETPHYVVLILSKVDPIFVNEARNAFARHNRDLYYNKQMNAEIIDIDADNRLLLMSPFKNSQEAVDYVEQTRPRTASEIIPWLKGGKYTFTIITERNLELLKNSKDIDKYSQFLNQHLPGKF